MERVAPPSQPLNFYTPSEFFGPESTMHHPLLKPLRFESPGRRLGHKSGNCRSPEGTESNLRDGSARPCGPRPATTGVENGAIRISCINRIPASGYYEEGYEVCLKEYIHVHILRKVT